ncbi:hypothetical protein ABZV61_19340 [Streptomyces sp900116325]|uniref:Uncharacterized protein n=1 Tax=Streptomyces sp. 900116325 TaxID=3154295 RepID=A0ABV2UAN1_9ACTN
MLIDAIVPFGDAFAVLTHGGSLTTALGVHVSAASLVLLTAVMLLTERPAAGSVERPAASSSRRVGAAPDPSDA